MIMTEGSPVALEALLLRRDQKITTLTAENVMLTAANEGLTARVEELTAANIQLTARVEELTAADGKRGETIESLTGKLTAAERKGKRQATPFSRGTHKSNPKRPGRRPGEGDFVNRKAPETKEFTSMEDVGVDQKTCPEDGCDGVLKHLRTELVSTTDVVVVRPEVRGYRMEVCACGTCGKKVRARHRDVAPDQRGATAHRVGMRAMMAAHWLHYGIGIPVRKVPAVLKLLTGLKVTQSAITQDALRRAEGRMGEAYRSLVDLFPTCDVAYVDSTSWKIGGVAAQLAAYVARGGGVGPGMILYQLGRHHRHQEVLQIIPMDFDGVMVTDRASTYDAWLLQWIKKQK